MRIFIPILFLLSTVASQQTATPSNILCYQEIVGSNSNYAAVDASISAWASKLETALGFSGDVHQFVDWAQVKDRTGFENGCDGPYQTVADVFVHIETTSQAYDDLSAKMEAFIAANKWPNQPNIACSARSIVTFLPGCGKLITGPSGTTTAPPTSSPSSGSTSAPSSGATSAPSSNATSAPSSGSTSAPSSNATSAPSSGSTEAPTSTPGTTSAPTSGATSAPNTSIPTSGPSEKPTPANVVCYQSIFGANVSYANLSVSIEAWANRLQAALNMTGDVHLIADWAQVGDRTGFEGCDGPFQTVADVFIHIPTTASQFDALSLKLESFVLANPLTSEKDILCAARSVTTFLPTCGKVPSLPNTPNGGSGTACYQSIVGSNNGTWTQVETELSAWATKLATALGLSGDIHQYVDWAQVPDRNSFENGCNGPYATVADIFVHISTTSANYNTIVANIASFTATNAFVNANSTDSVISCAAVSDTSVIPICGLAPVATDSAAGAQGTNTYSVTSGAQSITLTGSVIVTIFTLLFRLF
jgi:hypothetical protein